MKITILSAAILAIASMVPASEARSPQATIGGYSTGEFAVKGAVEEQLQKQVLVPLETEIANSGNAGVEIDVTGYADQTGGGAVNDTVAQNRANEVGAWLSEKFPTAKIITLSRGDEMDIKEVTVTWKLFPVIAASQPQQNRASWARFSQYGTVGGIVLLLLCCALFKAFRPKSQPEVPVQLQPASTPQKLAEQETFELELEGIRYQVPVRREIDPGQQTIWITPFFTQEDPNARLTRRDRGNARQAVRSCLKNPHYLLAVEKLIATGQIKILQEEGRIQ